MHTKIIIFAVCPNFSIFLCNCSDFFFPENFFTTITNKTKKKRIMYIHHKKALLVFHEFSYFPGNFSNFSLHKNLIRIITNIKKKLAKSFQPFPQKKALSVFPEFSNFPGNFSDFFFLFKPPLK
jgi:hypothetical protein